MRIIYADLEALAAKYQGRALFKLIYISEAHTEDTWPISSSRGSPQGQVVRFNLPRNLDERLHIARCFQKDFNAQLEIWLDETGQFEALFAAWPLRLFIICGEEIVFISEGYQWLPHLEDKLMELLGD